MGVEKHKYKEKKRKGWGGISVVVFLHRLDTRLTQFFCQHEKVELGGWEGGGGGGGGVGVGGQIGSRAHRVTDVHLIG